MGKLTAAKVKRLTEPGRYSDGGNLYLYITSKGARSWIQKVVIDKKRTDKGLGSLNDTTLAEARRKAKANTAALKAGVNPWLEAAKEERDKLDKLDTLADYDEIPTFEVAARRLHKAKIDGKELTNARTQTQWIQSLERHVFPLFGSVALDKITQRHVKFFLEDLARKGIIETALKIRTRMKDVFADAIESEYIDANPAGDAIALSVKRWSRSRQVLNFASLPYEDVPAAFETIQDSAGMRETRLALQLMILTASRGCEVRGAKWDEIDLEARVWTIPADRMKAKRAHRVPLSTQAQVVLQEAKEGVAKRRKRRKDYNPNGLVFPHPSGKPLSGNALPDRVRKDGLQCVPHGFRSSFRDWAAEMHPTLWAATELSLAHAVGSSVERSYFRSDLLDQRRDLMQDWASYVWDVLPF